MSGDTVPEVVVVDQAQNLIARVLAMRQNAIAQVGYYDALLGKVVAYLISINPDARIAAQDRVRMSDKATELVKRLVAYVHGGDLNAGTVPVMRRDLTDAIAFITESQGERERELELVDRAYDQGRFDQHNSLPELSAEGIIADFDAQSQPPAGECEHKWGKPTIYGDRMCARCNETMLIEEQPAEVPLVEDIEPDTFSSWFWERMQSGEETTVRDLCERLDDYFAARRLSARK